MRTVLVPMLLRQVQSTESVLQWHSQQGAPEVPLPSLRPYGSARLLPELGPSPGHAASGPLPDSAAAPGRGDSPSPRPRAAVSAPRPIWGRSGGGVSRGRNSISDPEPWPLVTHPHPPARDTILDTQILSPRAETQMSAL